MPVVSLKHAPSPFPLLYCNYSPPSFNLCGSVSSGGFVFTCDGQVCSNGQSAWVLCYGQVCASGQSAWVCAMVRCVPVVSQHGFVLWSGVCQWSVSMGLCYGQVCASGQSAWVCAMVRCVPVVSQHGFVLWSGVCQWSVSMGLCYGQVCASGQSAWVCAMVRCVPVVSQHGFVLWSGCVPMVKSAWVCAMIGVCLWFVFNFAIRKRYVQSYIAVQIIAVHQWCQTALKSSFVFHIYNILVSYNVYSTQTW